MLRENVADRRWGRAIIGIARCGGPDYVTAPPTTRAACRWILLCSFILCPLYLNTGILDSKILRQGTCLATEIHIIAKVWYIFSSQALQKKWPYAVNSMVLQKIAWYCMALRGIAWYYMVVPNCHRLYHIEIWSAMGTLGCTWNI